MEWNGNGYGTRIGHYGRLGARIGWFDDDDR